MKNRKIMLLPTVIAFILLLNSLNSVVATNPYGLTHTIGTTSFSETIDIPLTPLFPNDNASVFFTYANASGVEVAYLALEDIEMELRLSDVFSDLAITAIEAAGFSDFLVANISGTTPFQQLLQHWETISDPTAANFPKVDKFVANNFQGLLAYSTTPTDKVMDATDNIYMGYTMALTQLTDVLNKVLTEKNFTEVPQYSVEPIYTEVSANEIHFGMRYNNMMTFWQQVDEEPINPLLDNMPAGLLDADLDKLENMVAGFHAATLFDYLEFEYILTWEEETIGIPGIAELTTVKTNIDSHYNIGEVKWMVTQDTVLDAVYNDSFVETFTYDIDLPGDGSIGVGPLTIPDKVSGDFSFAFYPNEEAQMRINEADGFGFGVLTQTNSVGLVFREDFWDPTGASISTTSEHITDFKTSFENKDTYKLKGVEHLGFDATLDRNVTIVADSYSNLGYAITPLSIAYVDLSQGLYKDFTNWLVTNEDGLGFNGLYLYPVSFSNYMTVTEFGDWVGGEIIHDPSYSAVAAVAATATPDETSTDDTSLPDGTEPKTTEGLGTIPGFELIPVLLAIPPIYALKKKKN